MPTVSLIGKTFICDADFEAGDEVGGKGLQLNLRVREMCKKYLKPHGPVLATLHVSVSNGRPNDITKCKELLAFLKDQVLPKSLKLINLKRIKKMKDEEKNEGVNWLNCIWPGKTRNRKDKARSKSSKEIQTTRGYCSDTENCIQDCRRLSNEPGVEARYQDSKAGILATPVLVRPRFLRKANAKEKEKRQVQDKAMPVNCSLARISKEKGKTRDGVNAQKSHTFELNPNLDCKLNRELHKKNNQEIGKHGINLAFCKREGERFDRVDPQCVQNEHSDWFSCSDISASDSFVGFCLSKKSTDDNYQSSNTESLGMKSMGSVETGMQYKLNTLNADIMGINKNYSVELFGTLQTVAATIVRKICEVAFSRCIKETTKDIAMKFVVKIVIKAQEKLMQEETTKPLTVNYGHDEKNDNMCLEEVKSPSFSKVWKYSRSFPSEIFESLKINDSSLRDKDSNTCSNSKEDGDVESKNDRQFEEFLERKLLDSLESGHEGMSFQSASYSSDKLTDVKIQLKNARPTLRKGHGYHSEDEELSAGYSLSNVENDNIQRSNEVSSGFGIHMKTYDQTIPGERVENGALTYQALTLESLASNDNCKEAGNKSKIQTEVKFGSNKIHSKDCNKTNFDFYPKVFEDDSLIPPEMFGSDMSNEGHQMTTGGVIPTENSSETWLGSESFSVRRFLYKRTVSESQASERKQWSALESVDSILHSFHSSALSCNASSKYFRSSSCPVVSEDDVFFEGMLSHHGDVCDSLSRRNWIILHVHELWNSGRPIDAIKNCINLTGMADIEQPAPLYEQVARDYALFLNILQQLPSSCSMWSLDLFMLVLPKLKGFISSQHHTSHVEMACGIIHVVLKKVAVIIRRTSKACKNKDKEKKVKSCINELRDIKDTATHVLQAVKSGNRSNTEEPGSMKSVLRELQIALGAFFEQL